VITFSTILDKNIDIFSSTVPVSKDNSPINHQLLFECNTTLSTEINRTAPRIDNEASNCVRAPMLPERK